jgi:hypothetical protein
MGLRANWYAMPDAGRAVGIGVYISKVLKNLAMSRMQQTPIKPVRTRQQLESHYAFIIEEFEGRTGFTKKPMFSCLGLYLGERLTLVLASKDEPWNGLLVPTEREWQPGLQAQFPALMAHEVLGKWLYVSQTHPDFESVANSIVELALRGDERIGVVGQKKVRKPPKGRRERSGGRKKR